MFALKTTPWRAQNWDPQSYTSELSNNIVSVTTAYAIFKRVLYMFVNCYYTIVISVHMKYQVLLSTGGTFENISNCRVTSYSLSIQQRFIDNQCISDTNDTDFAWYIKM